MYKAVVIDLDGTLLNDKGKPGEKDLQTLHDLGEAKVCRIIATGRSLYSVSEVLPADFPIDYLIFEAGAGIRNFKTKDILKTSFIHHTEVRKIARKLDELKLDFQVRCKIPQSHKYFYRRHKKHNPDFDRLNSVYAKYVIPLSNIEELPDAARFIIISDDDSDFKLLKNIFSGYSVLRASSPVSNRSVWTEIYPENINKGEALKFLCDLSGIKLSDTVGLGNDYNDIHFLDITGKAYVVENTPDILKEKYNITVSNNQNPLASICNSVFFSRFEGCDKNLK
ncbi:MAG: HAD family phosphatase [Chlorobi bacterium]|nr:HAD family phosphatase [Chlorobiota bacterium]